MNTKILVVTHKNYDMPSDSIYVPIQSGSILNKDLGYLRDDSGDNISDRNIAYNELCPLYWAWKNIDAENIGLVHYRRHLSLNKNKKNIENVLTLQQINKLFEKADIILPPMRKYYFESVYTHYVKSQKNREQLHSNDLKALKEIIIESHKDYLEAFNKVMSKNKAHMFHIFIMKKDKFNEYCEFLFDIAFKLEDKLHSTRPDKTRYIGGITEFLMDIWIEKNNYNYVEANLLELEKKNIIIRSFLVFKRKFINYNTKL